jgi:peptidoglycan hydrolase CwlO-like protein
MNFLQVRTTAFSTTDISRFINRAEQQVSSSGTFEATFISMSLVLGLKFEFGATDLSLQDVREKRKGMSTDIRALQQAIHDTKSRANSLQDGLTEILADSEMISNEVSLKEARDLHLSSFNNTANLC